MNNDLKFICLSVFIFFLLIVFVLLYTVTNDAYIMLIRGVCRCDNSRADCILKYYDPSSHELFCSTGLNDEVVYDIVKKDL